MLAAREHTINEQAAVIRKYQRLLRLAAKFLHYSWSPIDYEFNGLTTTEKRLTGRTQFTELKNYILTEPCPDIVEVGPAQHAARRAEAIG